MRHATEDITSGSAWENLLDEAQQQQKLPNKIEASLFLQRQMQKEAWPKGLESIKRLPPRQRDELQSKTPFMDQSDGLIKVGGRLSRADLTFARKHPTLVPDNLTGDTLLGYLHSKTEHQGRKITTASIREEGFWPVGGRNRIDRIVATCVPCRALRAPTMTQKWLTYPNRDFTGPHPSTIVALMSSAHSIYAKAKPHVPTREFGRCGFCFFHASTPEQST